ncbi:TatD family hydrolase [Bacillus cytotoxicus]|uniref:TatD family hydrolase n=1 Tax=Bacillus cytotoxicus TaxID=580165 RepID=A0ACC6AAQ0_9BACI|nr:TatD family hydrolase [Bacillus cytotoxicus]
MKWIDSHIHLDQYKKEEQLQLIEDIQKTKEIAALMAVSMNEHSCQQTLELAKSYSFIYPALGYHPEQDVDFKQCERICELIEKEAHRIAAIGEVGLPYYLRQENKALLLDPYIEMLERFVYLARKYNLPIILHAVYDDADVVCDLLETYRIRHAHFHWFKGSQRTMERMIQNGYYISITPDIVYKDKIKDIAAFYPLSQLMVETDGPWKFTDEMTHPNMILQVLKSVSEIKGLALEEATETIYKNTVQFYNL